MKMIFSIISKLIKSLNIHTALMLISIAIISYMSYKVYDAFKSKKELVSVNQDLTISKSQNEELQKITLNYRNDVKNLKLIIVKDSITIYDLKKQLLVKDTVISTKDKQIVEIQKLIKPLNKLLKSYKDSTAWYKEDYNNLLKKSNRKPLFRRNIK